MHRTRFTEITKEFPVNDFLFEEQCCETPNFESFFELHLPEPKLVENTLTIMYGPEQSEKLVPRITFWGDPNALNVSWGLVNTEGYMMRG